MFEIIAIIGNFFEIIGKILKSILKLYILVIVGLVVIGLLGVESIFGMEPIVLASGMIGLPLGLAFLAFFYSSLIKGFLFGDDDNESRKSSALSLGMSSEGEYLDTASALSHGMSYEDVIKYNTNDWNTRQKYRHIAPHIQKTDRNPML